MTRAILSTLILICCVHTAACQDQRSKASSDTTRGEGPVRDACQIEIEKFCRGEERAGRCLRNQNPSELSERCRTALANRGTK